MQLASCTFQRAHVGAAPRSQRIVARPLQLQRSCSSSSCSSSCRSSGSTSRSSSSSSSSSSPWAPLQQRQRRAAVAAAAVPADGSALQHAAELVSAARLAAGVPPPAAAAAAAVVIAAAMPLHVLGEGLETPIQLIYLVSLLGILGVGAFLVVRQVLIRRELDEAAKALGERIRTGEATCEDFYELGVILTRKKLYTQATKNLEKAKGVWDGEEADLAQVHNALGFCYFNMDKVDMAIAEYQRAVQLQQGYVTAWNNLGDAYERAKQWRKALEAYQEALTYAPNNKVAQGRSEFCRARVENLGL